MHSLNNALFSVLQDLTEVGVVGTDSKGIIYFFNKGAMQILGYHPGEVMAAPVSLLFSDPPNPAKITLPYFLTGLQQALPGNSQTHTLRTKRNIPVNVTLSVQQTDNPADDTHGFLIRFSLVNLSSANNEHPVQGVHRHENDPMKEIAGNSSIPWPGNKNNTAEVSLQLLFSHNPQPMWVFEQNSLRFLHVNEAAIRHYGYSLEEFFSMTIMDIRPKEIQPAFKAFIKSVPHQTEKGSEWQHVKKDGSIIDVNIITHRIDYQGRPARLVVIQDITKQKMAEAEMKRSQYQLQAIFENSFDALFLVDAQTLLTSNCNQRAIELFEAHHKEQLIGIRGDRLHKHMLSNEQTEQFYKQMADAGRFDYELPYLTLKGNEFYGHLAKTSLQIGDKSYYLVRVSDITQKILIQRKQKESEQRFARLIHGMHDGLFIFTYRHDRLPGNFTQVNDLACQMLGYTREELLKMSPADLSAPEMNKYVEEQLKDLFAHKFALFDNIVVAKNGTKIPVEISTTILETEGQLTCLALMRDISKRKEAEDQVKRSQASFNAIFEESPIGMAIVNQTGRLVEINQAFCRMIGYTKEEMLQMRFSDFTHPEDIQNNLDIRERTLRGEISSYQLEKRYITKNKDILWARITGISYKQDESIYTAGIVENITERKTREAELLKAKQEAEAASLAKQQFLSTMSHELRTPMNAVIGLTHLLLQENPRSEQVENLNMLKFSSENLLALINDILDFSKIEAGKINLEKVDFNIRNLVTSIRNSLQLKAGEKNIALNIHIAKQVPALVTGDPVRLTQILNNLLSNAIKFTEKGSVTLSVSLEEETPEAVQLYFEITDTGIGIPANKTGYIFESFSQASSDITRKYGGTGLGLAITKRLLELQGSQIHVKSRLGKGSTFYFTIKLNKAADKGENMRQVPKLPIPAGLHSLQLLLVEDHEINQVIASKFLNKWSIYPDYANNGLEAVEKVKSRSYDIILMDLQMPEMNGYDATRAIRLLPGCTNLPIIALTADAVMDVKEKAMAAGMSDFITKPFNPDELYGKIVQYVRQPAAVSLPKALASSQPSHSADGVISYKQVYELAGGDKVFVEKLITSCIGQIHEFKNIVHRIVSNKSLSQFSSVVHKMQPMIRLFEMDLLAQNLNDTQKLLENTHVTYQELDEMVTETMRICNCFLEQLHNSQK